jgi:TonB-linked SusC/RagA family outer membrane protein
MKKNLLMSFLFISCLLFSAMAQERKITGKVSATEDGSSLPGVSIQLKGTAKGVQTDASGNYNIGVPENGGTLIFSYIGLVTQEVAIGNQSIINLQLANDTKALSEVVVTAIGIQRDKRSLGYSSSSVKADALAQKSEPDPLRGLTGKVPGVNIVAGGGAPGQGTRITIRGNSSFDGNNQPLFVVDGIPFDNSSNNGASGGTGFNSNSVISNRAYDIDPNNVESMTILKGAAASALYGSRAANGVVIITTKSGSKSARKGLEVTFNTSYSVEDVSSLPDYQDKYVQGSNQNYSASFIGNWGPAFPAAVDEINASLGFNRYTKTLFAGYPEGTVPHPLVTSGYGAPRYPSVFPELMENGKAVAVPLQAYDIVGGFFKTGKVAENGISISSGGDKTSLNAGVSNTKNEGIIPNSKTERTSLTFGGNANLANGLILSGNVNYVHTTQQSPQSGASYFADYGSGSTGSIYSRLFYLPRNYNLNGYPFENPVDGSNVFYRALDNPLWTAKYNLYNSNVNRVFGNLALAYDVTPWLNVLAKGGVNTYTDIQTNVVRPGGTATPLGASARGDISRTELDYTFIATATHDFSEKINTKLLVGANANERSGSDFGAVGTQVIDPSVINVGSTLTQQGGEYSFKRRLYGIFGELTVGYGNNLFLTASVRNDYSSTLPKANQSYLYPAVTATWVFSDALNLPKTILNFGKLRANYAKVGKDADPYLVNTVYNLGTTYANGNPYSVASLPGILNNANLKPEFTTEIEFGTELQFLNSRVGVDLAYFDRKSTDLIVSRRIATSSGFYFAKSNAGQINNNGIELGLTLVPIKTQSGFTWSTFTAYTRLRSEVISTGGDGDIILSGVGNSNLGSLFRVGQPYGMIFGSQNARSESGKLLINPEVGYPIPLPESQILGNPAPKYTVGFTNTFTYKGFTLSALLDYRHGGSMFSVTAGSLLLRGQLASSEDREGMRVIPGVYGDVQTGKALLVDGKEVPNTIPMSAFQYHFSSNGTGGFGAYGADETNVYDVTVIRLREVSLGYNIPKKFLDRYVKFLGSLRVSASGRNLWFYAPNMLKGLNFDPEVLSSFASSNVQGFDLGAAPSTRRFGFNLTTTF